jgi:hypothetical protein
MEPNHPSFLELDRLALGASREATRAHVDQCPQCQAHLAQLEWQTSVPDWVRGRGAPKPRTVGARWRLLGLVATFAGAAAVWVMVSHVPPAETVGAEKAAGPGVALYVKHGDQVLLWDGQTPVHPGDHLRLQVAPEGFAHIRVTGEVPSDVLYEADLPAAGGFLPLSWRVDEAPQEEVLDVTLSGPGKTPWHGRLTLPKAPGASAP